MSKRMEKVAQAIQHKLGEIIIKETKDPNLKHVSITRVDVSADLRHAHIFFSTIIASPQKALESLQKAKGMLKLELAKRIRMKYLPDLVFFEDKGIEHSLKITKILRELEKE